MPEKTPPPTDLAGLRMAEIERAIADRRAPPVDRWDPPFCGDSGMVIAADGHWSHEGVPIARPAMVRLFAGLLRPDPDHRYVLVTPVEKLAIAVADLPFVAVGVVSEGSGRDRTLAFRLGTDEPVIAGAAHPLHLGPGLPSLLVRPGLSARITRALFYDLVDLALEEGADVPGLWSQGTFFPLEAQ